MTPIAPHIAAFLQERLPTQRGASDHTCDSYAYCYQLLFQFASERFKVTPSQLYLEQIDAQLVMDFLEHLEVERSNSASSRNIRLAAIKSFFRFVEHRVSSIIEQSRRILAIPIKKTDTGLVNHLSVEEIKAILNAPDISTKEGIRDRAMLHLCFAAGLRVSELVNLPLTAFTPEPYPTIFVVGKGRKERKLPLWKAAAIDLRAWLAIRGDSQVPELFLNARGGAMTRFGFNYLLQKHTKGAAHKCPLLNDKQVSPHVIRHSCAMVVLQATGDIRKVSLWLGHTDMQSTQKYLRANPTEKLEVLKDVVPPMLRKGRFQAPDKLLALLRDGE